MRRDHQVHAARRQALVLAACVGAAVAGVVAFVQRPAEESELKIPVGELRSQSAELRMLDRDLAAGLSGTFVRAHASQLAQAIDRSRDELSTMKTETRLDAAKGDALRRSAPLVQAAAALHDRRAPLGDATNAQLAEAGAALQALEERLRR